MPTPVAHSLAGACVAVLVSRRIPAGRAVPVVAAILFAANLPDVDFLALARGREAMERFHQGPLHSIGFIAAATVPLALLLRGRLAFARAWLVLAGAGLTHLLLDLAVVDHTPPVGFPLFWPWTAERFHAAVELFPATNRSDVLSVVNLRAVIVELTCGIPAFLISGWRPRRVRATSRR